MALPTYRQQVSPAAAPQVRPSTSARGASGEAQAAGAERLGAVATDLLSIGAREMEENDRARVMDAEARVSMRANGIFRGLTERRGKNAAGADGWALSEFDKAVTEESAELTTAQRHRLRTVIARQRVGVDEYARGHVFKEFQAYKDVGELGAMEASVARGAALPGASREETALRREAFEKGRAAVTLRSERLGLPPEAAARADTEYVTRYHLAVAQARLAQEDGAGTKAYLTENAPFMDAEVLARSGVARAADALHLREQAHVAVAEMVGANPHDKAEHLRALESIQDATLQKAVRASLETYHDAREEGLKKAHADMLGRVYERLERSRGRLDLDTDPDFTRLDPQGRANAWERLRVLQRTGKDASASDRREQSLDDREAMLRFSEMRERYPERAMALQNAKAVELEFSLASPVARQAILAEQAKFMSVVRKGEAPAEAEFYRAVRAEAAAAGVAEKDKQNAFVADMASWRSEYLEKSGGKAPTREEVRKRIADRLLWGEEDTWGPSSNKHKFEAASGSTFNKFPVGEQKSPLNKRVKMHNESTGETLFVNAADEEAAAGDGFRRVE